MADDYASKLESLQQYIPFLENMIGQLRDPSRKNREQQLHKLESLHAMITDKRKKLKFETLVKCEDVILKLYEKVNKGRPHPVDGRRFSEVQTPASPSPPRDIPSSNLLVTKPPVVIPTEKVEKPREVTRRHETEHRESRIPKVDVYSSAAESLKKGPSTERPSVFDRLGGKLPDMSVPPISEDDLKSLAEDEDEIEEGEIRRNEDGLEQNLEYASLNELRLLQEKLAKELKDDCYEGINTTVRNNKILTSKKVLQAGSSSSDRHKKPESSRSSEHPKKEKESKTLTNKIIVETNNIFGSILSSIDSKLIPKVDKKDKKDKPSDKKDKREEKKDKREEKKDKREEKKDKKEEKKDRKDEKKDRKDEKKDKKEEKKEKREEQKDKKEKQKTSAEIPSIKESPNLIVIDEVKSPDIASPPRFKRLADKYNPKPRKPSLDTEKASKKLEESPKLIPPALPASRVDSSKDVRIDPRLSGKTSDPRQPPVYANKQAVPVVSPANYNASYYNASLTPSPVQTRSYYPQQSPSHSSYTAPVMNQFSPTFQSYDYAAYKQPTPSWHPNTNVPMTYGEYKQQKEKTAAEIAGRDPRNRNWSSSSKQNEDSWNDSANPSLKPVPCAQIDLTNDECWDNDVIGSTSATKNDWPSSLKNNDWGGTASNDWPASSSKDDWSSGPSTSDWNSGSSKNDWNSGSNTNDWNSGSTKNDWSSNSSRNDWSNNNDWGGSSSKDWSSGSKNDWGDSGSKDWSSRSRGDSYGGGRSKTDWGGSRRSKWDNKDDWSNGRSSTWEKSSYNRNDDWGSNKSYGDSSRKYTDRHSYGKRDEEDWTKDKFDNMSGSFEPANKSYGASAAEEENWDDDVIQPASSASTSNHIPVPEVPLAQVEENWNNDLIKPTAPAVSSWDEPLANAIADKPQASVESEPVKKSEPKPAKESEPSTESVNEPVKETEPTKEPEAKNPAKEESKKETSKSPEIKPEEAETNILSKFFGNLLGGQSSNKKSALLTIINTFSETIGEKQIKRIKDIIQGEESDEECKTPEPLVEVKKHEPSPSPSPEKMEVTPKSTPKKNRRKTTPPPPVVRPKTRSSPASLTLPTPAPTLRPRKCRTELDMLHEDIQEMFIRDGVLTASGKRMCRILKEDPTVLNTPEESPPPPVTEPTKRRKPGPKSKINSERLMADVKIVLSKIPDEVCLAKEELRRCNSEAKEAEELVSKSPLTTKKVRRKRSNWAAGVIKKKRKKINVSGDTTSDVESEAGSSVITEPENFEKTIDDDADITRYSSLSIKQQCKLCPFNGRFLSIHYREKHPESDVLIARFDQKTADLAIKDSEENLEMYEEQCRTLRAGQKNAMKFRCRFCNFVTTNVPGCFYDHMAIHTGNFRHKCMICNHEGTNQKSIRKHITTVHPESGRKIIYTMKFISVILFGYLCTACNYVQLIEDVMMEHVKKQHKEGARIVKINLSTEPVGNACKKVTSNDKKMIDQADDEEPSVLPEVNTSPSASETRSESVDTNASSESKTSNKRKLHEAEETQDEVPAKKKKRNDKVVVEDYFTPELLPNRRRAAKERAEEIMKVQLMEVDDKLPRSKPSSPVKVPTTKAPTIKAPIIKPPTTKVPTTKVPMKSISLDEAIEAVATNTNTTPVVKSEPKSSPEPIVKPEPKKDPPKAVDLNVFTCNTDHLEDNKKIEEERMQMMEELNKAVGSRNSLNFVDQLSNRLMNEKQAENLIKQEKFADDGSWENSVKMIADLGLDITALSEESTMVAPESSKKPDLESNVFSAPTNVAVAEKTNDYFSGLLQKLQGVLNNTASTSNNYQEDEDKDGPPPLIHMNNMEGDDSEITLNVGFIKLIKNRLGVTYSCQVPPCLFSSNNRVKFEQHCMVLHQWLIVEKTVCLVCQMEVSNPVLRNLMAHVVESHARFWEEPQAVKALPIRMRRLSGDMLSLKDDILNDVAKEVVDSNNPMPVLTLNENDLNSFEEDSQFDLEKVSLGEIELTPGDNPFPFKIVGVMSLADGDAPPPLTPISPLKARSNEMVTLHSEESNLRPKHPNASVKYLKCINELYKCPNLTCSFSTNKPEIFEKHLDRYTSPNQLIACVYCNMKTKFSAMRLHIDVRHAHCRYACLYCLYRAFTKEYVLTHQEIEHPKEERSIVTLSRHKNAETRIAEPMVSAKQICTPYVCSNECHQEFLFENDFHFHLITQHTTEDGIGCGFKGCSVSCKTEEMVAHWNDKHNICRYVCSYCEYSCAQLKQMLIHFAKLHQFCGPDFLHRIGPLKMGYTNEAFKHLTHLNSFDINATEVYPLTPVGTSSQQREAAKLKEINCDLLKKPEPEGITTKPPPRKLSELDETSSEPPEFSHGKEKLFKTKAGLSGSDLYKCCCYVSFSNANQLRDHVTASRSTTCKMNDGKASCVHCRRVLKSVNGLIDHLQNHGALRFSCSLCDSKFPTALQIRSHMKNRHHVTRPRYTPIQADKTDLDLDMFVVRPKLAVSLPEESPTNQEAGGLGESVVYMPDRIDEVPMRSIFSSMVRCGVCQYSTKVRTNLVRHLQFHNEEKSVPDTAPVNPVPCLDKNEKMFDKMTNLALSSFSGGRMGSSKAEEAENLPDFVPSHGRYVCCAVGCNYLCPEEGNLRHHLNALHDGDSTFVCVHCKRDLSPTDADGLMKHFKMHALHLYKCSLCPFHHNLKHKVEKHLSDNHSNSGKLLTIRCMDSEPCQDLPTVPSTSSAGPPKVWRPWRCCMCKSRANTMEDIQQHVFLKHEIDTQYKCTRCTYKTNEEETFEEHFKVHHEGQKIDFISAYIKFDGDEKKVDLLATFDTTPLWQRDRPRVRHIRGILFDDSVPAAPQKSPKKPSKPAGSEVKKSKIDPVKVDDIFDLINKNIQPQDLATVKGHPIIVDSDEEPLIKHQDSSSDLEAICYDESMKPSVLIEEFGPLGEPFRWQINCPRCQNFKTKQVVTFVNHLYRHFNYPKFTCWACKKSGTTYSSMFSHSCKTPNLEVVIKQSFEVWIQMVVYYQSRQILNSKPFPPKIESELDGQVVCNCCHKRYKDLNELSIHQLDHWSKKPFACIHCNFESLSHSNAELHCKNIHPNQTVKVRSIIPTTDQLVKQDFDIKHHVKKFKVKIWKDEGKVQASPAIDLDKLFELDDEFGRKSPVPVGGLPPDDIFEDSKPLLMVKKVEMSPSDEQYFFCNICPEYFRTSGEMGTHNSTKHHEAKGKYLSAVQPFHILACQYCPYMEDELNVRRHYLKTHHLEQFRPMRYQCGLCPKRFSKLPHLTCHFKLIHKTQNVTFNGLKMPNEGYRMELQVLSTTSKSPKKTGIKAFHCDLCDYISVSAYTKHIRAHYKVHFYPFNCTECTLKFRSVSAIKKHYQTAHDVMIGNGEIATDQELVSACQKGIAKVIKEARIVPGTVVEDEEDEDVTSPNKNTARKSTGGSPNKPKQSPLDLRKIITTVEINKSPVTMSADQLSKIFNLFPFVSIVDCIKHPDWLKTEEL